MWLALLLAVPLVSATREVVPLTRSNFASFVGPEELWLLKFYAPWCGHCKRLAPVLDKVAAEVDGVRFGKVDCTTEERLCKEWKVSGYPTVVLTQGTSKWVYKGPRNAEGIKAVTSKMLQPAVHELRTAAEVAEVHKDGRQVVFLSGRAAGADTAAFDSVARTLQHSDHFYASMDPELHSTLLAEMLPMPTPPFVARLESGEAPQIFGGGDAEALQAFVEAKRTPTFSLIGDYNFYSLGSTGRPLAILLVNSSGLAGPSAEKRTLRIEDSTGGGIAAEFRAFSRDPELGKTFVFGMLDTGEFGDYLKTGFFVEGNSSLRMLILWKSSYSMLPRSFYTDDPGEASSPATIRYFLQRVESGQHVGEFESHLGMPARWWRIAKGKLPALAYLDFLPRFTFVGILAIIALRLLLKLLTYGMDDEYDEHGASSREAKKGQ